ncbi:DUF5955 family protein [Streptomyces griseocarneus]|uniref:DUF5955 family protein n=1 Tax=Streptomyces griseocarneus TaxID=51201 RepID=UPI001CCF315A|nr:DUF5955 family protein [Streptomyces griseocarneus]MBZ6472692.1 DUF5955 family protein [Streptomyces griseocarneus]
MEEERAGRFGEETDPRVDELGAAVSRLRRELAGHPAPLPDRDAAEDELAALDAMARAGAPDVSRLRRSLLLVAGAVGSVSALAPALGAVRAAVDRFGELPGAPAAGRPAGGAEADAAEVPRPREGS